MEMQPKVLIVDDERFNINVLAELLKPHYKIMAAINGQQALKAARSDKPPHLILLDIMMPEMDGYEVCRQLKADENTKGIPIIFVTAMGQESDETKGLEMGAADYITKPISPPIVEARVKTQLALRQSMVELESAKAIIEAQKNRMQDELDVGKRIQLSLLPQDFPPFPDRHEFDVHAIMLAAREVGGDFYDYFFIDDDHLCLCVGDVSGKGVPAALFMAIAKALIKSRAADDLSTASILTHVNDEICENNEECMFVTVFLSILNIRSGQMTYTNAGHNPPYIKHANNELERLDNRHGAAVGAVDGLAYKEDSMLLDRDDMLLMYTDGVTEAMDPNRDLFEEHRLVNLFQSHDFESPEHVIRETIDCVQDFANGAEQADDITMLALRYQRQSPKEQAKTLHLTIPNRLDEIDPVNDKFEAFAVMNEISREVTQKIKLVFDEFLNNIVSYGYTDQDEHEIGVEVELLEGRLMVTMVDDGVPFNPFLKQAPDTTLSIEERDIGGLGIHLVRNFVDEVSYKRGVGKNSVTLIKYLQE
jgi:sigma-B regulation protein RsbU (phosphoserine phosphatase)